MDLRAEVIKSFLFFFFKKKRHVKLCSFLKLGLDSLN